MKTKDIAKQYGLNIEILEEFLSQSRYTFKMRITGNTVEDFEDIAAIVEGYKYFEGKKIAEKERLAKEYSDRQAALAKAETAKKAALANMLITSGFNFDGYTITKYSGYISGDDAVQVDRGLIGTGFWAVLSGQGVVNVKDKLLGSLVEIRRNALAELKEAAYSLGCNAVIGVDFDYLTLDPVTATSAGGTVYQPYIFGVTANGNAVIIEKNQ